MIHNSILAYRLRLDDVRTWLRNKFNDQTIVVEKSGEEFVFYLPRALNSAEKEEILDLQK
ncbi:hypothetical protein HYE67_004096 [Fusarium culmorum]|uniref:Chromosome 3, complete genome n=2 Tax=Fusarium sambucinum species complex TaxID=569360 RepID=I1S7K7_GIBZE|nr:hypothetical protein FGSG_12830 [Fusarium graminearum PH-1]PCD31953.1 hypothetical protein FGRA07_09952 [Fusarium graminearum]QPC61865.1 hypothetical protein HYE67_004096 [Fusarium culmorum]ESU11894.1 hypothetical protein FGSG_12830 [Fusarium graminearum PH-1]CEF88197.1 unnamed protein product [Fusarium graminearum]CZS84574.1 unnamed protein product [Fusarium graminearum]|eukprot:XP_011324470.1 hypothetical protein FGSG_12830 [Fusarium graminearum PH-1]